MAIAHLNGTDIYHAEHGQGIACLVMHGLGLDHGYLLPWLDPLATTMRLVYHDHRGNGRSGRPPLETLTFPQFTADADALREHLGFPKVALIGHCFGGFIGLEYALRYPERVSHLILICTGPNFAFGTPEMNVRMEELGIYPEIQNILNSPVFDNAMLARYFEITRPLYYHLHDNRAVAHHLESVIFDAAAALHGLALAAEWDVAPRLGEIRVPTLILSGRHDVICPPALSETLHRGIAGSTLAVFENSAHNPFLEEPDKFQRAVRDLLSSRPSNVAAVSNMHPG